MIFGFSSVGIRREFAKAKALGLAAGLLAACSGWAILRHSDWASAASAQTLPENMPYHSPTALAADAAGAALYVADETGSQVLQVDLAENRVSRSIPVPGHPTGIALNRTADRLYVTTDTPADSVLAVDLKTGKVLSEIPVGHAPRSPVLSADESLLYVCNRFDNDLSVIDLNSGRERKRIPLVREPFTASLSPDGRMLVVGNDKPAGSGKAYPVASAVSLIDTKQNEVVSNIQLPNGGVNIRGIAISPDGHYGFVSHILGRNQQPATQLDEGWLTTNAISIIDLKTRKTLNTVLLDQVLRGAGNPWGIAASQDGRKLVVSLAGVHEAAIIDLPPLLEKLESLGSPPVFPENAEAGYPLGRKDYRAVGRPDTDLTFMRNYLRRIPLKGRGPRPIVTMGGRAYLGMYFSGTIESIDLENVVAGSSPASLGDAPPESEARRGERLFHDASMSFQGWLSCSTCHPDGRSDGLNWDLSNDGIGNPKNVKSLLFSHRTPPVTWTGIFASLEDCVPFEIRTILFASRPEKDAGAIVAYLSSLQPVPSPYLRNGELSDAARRGEKVFLKAGCNGCHSGEFLTTMEKRSVGVETPGDPSSFDIPTLREVWRTAPYLHDGRAASIREIFVKFDPDNRHGKHQDLSSQEIDDLVQYVLTR